MDSLGNVKTGNEMENRDFDFQKWFLRRFSRHTPDNEPRRPGTFTLSEEELLTDLVYDFRAAHNSGFTEKKAASLCMQAIKTAECLVEDKRGYSLKGEPRIRFDAMWRIVADE